MDEPFGNLQNSHPLTNSGASQPSLPASKSSAAFSYPRVRPIPTLKNNAMTVHLYLLFLKYACMYVSMMKNNGKTKTVFFPPGKVSCWGTGSLRGRSQHQRQQLLLRDRQLRLPRVREGGFEKRLQRLQRLFRRWWLRSGSLPCSCCCILPSHLHCSGTGRCFRWIPLLRYYCTRSGGWRCWNHRLFCFLWHIPFYSSQKCPCWGSSRGSLWHQCSWVCSRFPHSQLVVLVAASEHRETTSEHPGVRRTKDLLFA